MAYKSFKDRDPQDYIDAVNHISKDTSPEVRELLISTGLRKEEIDDKRGKDLETEN